MLFIMIGIIAGFVAKVLYPRFGGLITDLVVSVAGAVLGGWLFSAFLGSSGSGWIGGSVFSVIGAVGLLLAAMAVNTRDRPAVA